MSFELCIRAYVCQATDPYTIINKSQNSYFIFTAEAVSICSQILLNSQTLQIWKRIKNDAKELQLLNMVVLQMNLIKIVRVASMEANKISQ